MNPALARTERLLGRENLERLAGAHVAVFGLGGVGSYVTEALCRGGIGKLTLVDYDTIDISNLNRQLQTHSENIGRLKAVESKLRCEQIMPSVEVDARAEKLDATTIDRLLSTDYDYVVDAIDMVSSKILLAVRCKELGIPLISAMGTGNKLAPERLKIADLYETTMCPLARVMRKELRKRGIEELTVVYSDEEPIDVGGRVPGSTSFVPPTAGLMLASHVIRSLIMSPTAGIMGDKR